MGSGKDDSEDMGAQETGYITSFSIDGEYTSITFSEATQCLSNGLRYPSDRWSPRNLTGRSRASSLTCCQLGIDRLVLPISIGYYSADQRP